MNKSSVHNTVHLTSTVMKSPLIHADQVEEAREFGEIGGHGLPQIAKIVLFLEEEGALKK